MDGKVLRAIVCTGSVSCNHALIDIVEILADWSLQAST